MGNPSNPSAVYRTVRALVIVTLVSQVCQLAISPVEASRKTSANTLPKETLAANAGVVHNNKANVGDEFVVPPKVAVSTVAWLTLAMAIATGLGAVPCFFVQVEPRWGGICNGVASGVMLAASFDLIQEGQKYGGGSWVVVGILSGGFFILLSQQFVHHHFGEVTMLDVKGADVPKMILVVSIMTLHSFGEGSGVGVSFAGPKGLSHGVMVTIAIAVHNIPEGLAVSLLLSNQGLSPKQSMLWSIFTSLPQPLVAVPAFLCAEAFHKFLPFCVGFAGGCMIWMVMAEVMPDSFKDAGKSEVATAATLAVTFMEALSALLDNNTESIAPANMLLAYLSLGIGPLAGATIHMLLLNSVNNKLLVNMATGIGEGVALVVAMWKPLQMLLEGRKLNFFQLFFLFFTGACFHFLLRKYVESKSKGSKAITESFLSGGANVMVMTPIARRACLAALMLWSYTFVEGWAMGVVMSPGIPHLVLPVVLHGLPRGVGVGSIVYGATGSKKGSSFAAVLTSLAGPMGAVCAALCGVVGSSGWLECWIVLACGGVFPWSRVIALFLRGQRGAFKGDPKLTYLGVSVGVVLTIVCLTTTRLVCLHTLYCGTSS